MALVTNHLEPVPHNRRVRATLLAPGGWRDDGQIEVVATWMTSVADDGTWSLDLPPQSSYVTTGTHYEIAEAHVTHRIVVPDGPGPHRLFDLLVDPVPETGAQIATLRLSQLADTEALADADTGQVPAWDSIAGEWVPTAAGGASGGDHGLLTGLADDDHGQYHTDVRGDARYYLQGQVDTALTGKAASGHEHPGVYEPAGVVVDHAAAADPHPGYAADAHTHPYEPAGTVAGHAAAADPHPGYSTDGHAHAGAVVFVGPEGSAPDPAVYGVWIVEP